MDIDLMPCLKSLIYGASIKVLAEIEAKRHPELARV
jgi:hypothetical protein